jgi:hypothetical protein
MDLIEHISLFQLMGSLMATIRYFLLKISYDNFSKHWVPTSTHLTNYCMQHHNFSWTTAYTLISLNLTLPQCFCNVYNVVVYKTWLSGCDNVCWNCSVLTHAVVTMLTLNVRWFTFSFHPTLPQKTATTMYTKLSTMLQSTSRLEHVGWPQNARTRKKLFVLIYFI